MTNPKPLTINALDDALDTARARETAERLARDVLSNPVIEDYRVEVEG